MKGTIPKEVAALLTGSQWKLTGGYSAFESVFHEGHRRQSDPSYYIVRTGTTENGIDNSGFSHSEAKALLGAGVFGGLAQDHGTHVAVNEHAQHALMDFLSETADAWSKYQARLTEASNKSRT